MAEAKKYWIKGGLKRRAIKLNALQCTDQPDSSLGGPVRQGLCVGGELKYYQCFAKPSKCIKASRCTYEVQCMSMPIMQLLLMATPRKVRKVT